jgi:hypothetical protein
MSDESIRRATSVKRSMGIAAMSVRERVVLLVREGEKTGREVVKDDKG